MPGRRSLLAALLLAAAIAIPAASAQPRDDVVFFQDVGPPGANGALVMSSGTPTVVVVFLHGWRDVGIAHYSDWVNYLGFSGADVIFPRYQTAAGGSPAKTLAALRAGIDVGLQTLTLRDRHVPLIVVGYDYGARLGLYYAANARRWGLPVPYAVDSIFPHAAPAGLPALGAIPASTRLVFSVAANERPAAADLVTRFASRARSRVRVVHGSPLAHTASSRATFWSPLDALIAQAAPTG